MTTRFAKNAAFAVAVLALSVTQARAQEFQAKLVGFEQVPSILSPGTGTLSLILDRTAQTITYTLSYSGLGTSVLASHIHFAKARVNGAFIVFFCGGGGRPACPSSGTVTGTITAADVIAVPAQNIVGGDFNDLVAVLTSHSAYVNVHTTLFPAGEIRGQIQLVTGVQ